MHLKGTEFVNRDLTHLIQTIKLWSFAVARRRSSCTRSRRKGTSSYPKVSAAKPKHNSEPGVAIKKSHAQLHISRRSWPLSALSSWVVRAHFDSDWGHSGGWHAIASNAELGVTIRSALSNSNLHTTSTTLSSHILR